MEQGAKASGLSVWIAGRPMALNILKGGFDLTVWARRAESMAPLLEGWRKGRGQPGRGGRGPALTSWCRWSIMRQTWKQWPLPSGGVAEGARPGLIYIDMSTIAPPRPSPSPRGSPKRA